MSVALSSRSGFLGAIESARRVRLSAYVMRAGTPLVRALERAARRGANVSVTLDGAPFERGGDVLIRENRAAARELRKHGVAVRMTSAAGEPLHLKAAVVDRTAFLDDRNWPAQGADTIVKTSDARDVAAVASALAGSATGNSHLATEKMDALRLESDVIAGSPGDRIDVESESFGFSPVSRVLRQRVATGAHVRLLIAERDVAGREERLALREMIAAGIEVRVGRSAEKLCVAGKRGWVGSANASYSSSEMLDWGMRVQVPAVVDALHAAFVRNWREARPVNALTTQPFPRTRSASTR